MRIQHVYNQNHHQQYTLVSYFLFDLMIEPRGSKEEVVGYKKASPKWLLVLDGTEEGTQKKRNPCQAFFPFMRNCYQSLVSLVTIRHTAVTYFHLRMKLVETPVDRTLQG
jgi:hypothetical protein